MNQKSIHAWRGSTVSTKVDTHQQQHRTPSRQIAASCRRRVGPVAGRERHGWRDRAYMDVLAASPQPDPPRHPTDSQLLMLILPASGRHYHGCRAAARPKPPPTQVECAHGSFPAQVPQAGRWPRPADRPEPRPALDPDTRHALASLDGRHIDLTWKRRRWRCASASTATSCGSVRWTRRKPTWPCAAAWPACWRSCRCWPTRGAVTATARVACAWPAMPNWRDACSSWPRASTRTGSSPSSAYSARYWACRLPTPCATACSTRAGRDRSGPQRRRVHHRGIARCGAACRAGCLPR